MSLFVHLQSTRLQEDVVHDYVSPVSVSVDVYCRNVHDITLSYCFFKVEEDEDTVTGDDDSSSGVRLHGPGELSGNPPPGVAEKLALIQPAAASPSAAAATQ